MACSFLLVRLLFSFSTGPETKLLLVARLHVFRERKPRGGGGGGGGGGRLAVYKLDV